MIYTPEQEERSCKNCRLIDICIVYHSSGQVAKQFERIKGDADPNELAWQVLAKNCYYFERVAR